MTGATDKTRIQAAWGAGLAVFLSRGVFFLNGELVPPPGAILSGSGGFDAAEWGDAASGTVLSVVNGFSDPAVIFMTDIGAALTEGATITDLAIDGSAEVANPVDGIRAFGPVNATALRNLFIGNMSGAGINCVTDPSASGQTFPFGWHCYHIKINSPALQGVVCSNHTDAAWIDVHVINSGGQGWSIAGPCPNSRFIACKAEFAKSGHDGFHLTGAWGSGTGSGGMLFIGCSTDRNDGNGVGITATGNTPVKFEGCMWRRDGTNGGAGGGGFAGFSVNGATIPISASFTVYPGVGDTGGGPNAPQDGVSIINNPALVELTGCIIHGATSGLVWDGTGTIATRNIWQRTGTTAAPTALAPFPDTGGKAGAFGNTPAAPAGTASLTLVMMGLGTTWKYTPVASGNVLVNVTGYVQTAVAAAQVTVGARFGTGAAPANGAAVTGTRFGAAGDPSLDTTGIGVPVSFAFTALLTGLTPGVPIWLDLALDTGNAADAASFTDLSITLAEQ